MVVLDIQRNFIMRELSDMEVGNISGGVIPLLAVLGFVYYERENISDFFEGAFEGYGDNQQAHR